jgi:hypothetical protein
LIDKLEGWRLPLILTPKELKLCPEKLKLLKPVDKFVNDIEFVRFDGIELSKINTGI